VSTLCLVATPLSAARAARRLCDASGGTLFGPRVATLERIVPGLLAAGGDRRAILPSLGERLLAAEAGRAARGALGDAAPDSGLAAALSAAIGELRRGEVGPDAARAAAATLDRGAAARLVALADALEAYEGRLRALAVLDRAGAALAAADAARRGATSAETGELDLLVVDGIDAVSPAEWDLLAALAGRARRSRFHLPYFPDRPDLCSPAEPLLRRVEALHEIAARREIEIVLPRLEGDGRAPLPAALLAAIAGGRAPPPSAAGIVLAEAGAGEAGEAEAATRVVLQFLERGLDPGEVVIVSPCPGRAAPALARAFAAAGVPFAAGRGAPLADAPAVEAALDLLRAAGALDRSSAERLAASSYLALTGVPGALGPLLDRAGALDGRGAPQEALRRRAAALAAPAAAREREGLLGAAGGLDALVAMLRPLGAPGTAREHATRLAALVETAGLRRRAARAPREIAARDLAALAALGDAMDGVARALALVGRGDERMDVARFRALAELAVKESFLPAAGEPAAGAVELWGLEEAPGLGARAAVLTGCARGAWPPAPRPEPLLRELERQAICRELRRAAVPTAPARRAAAAFRAFSAAAAGREAVAFVWAAPGPAGDGGPIAPLVADALAILGIPVPAAAPPDPPLARARTAREALRAAARAGRAAARALAGTPLAPRLAAALARGSLETSRREAVRARRAGAYAGAVTGRARAALRAALPDEWAPTQLEEYARCPFRLFLREGVRLEEPGADGLDIDGRDEGSLLHAVLERFVRARIERQAWPLDASEADLAEARAVAEEVLGRFEREGRTGDPAVWSARREALLGRLDRVVRAEARDHGGLSPALVEHAFGGRSGRPPLALAADGETVRMRGRIDRVDAGPDRLLVIDYKNARGGRTGYADLLDPGAFGHTSFQIPAYLLAAARDLPGRPRLLATYALLRSAERLAPLELRAADVARSAGEGAVAADARRPFAAAVLDVVRRVRDGDFPIASRSCERCPFGAVCRFEGVAAAGADEPGEAGVAG
jgi:hypothetical protein